MAHFLKPILKGMASVALVIAGSSVTGEPFPPTLSNGAAHFPPVAWPAEPANPLQCGQQCGEWLPYTRFQSGVADPRVQDPSNGGTAPQNYVNISSSCVDKSYPSVYYSLRQGAATDGTQDVIMFRWRVEQIANTYATGPSAGAYGASDPWSSALWSVMFDVDGDGYLDLAAHLDGSSGSPSASIDRIAGIWSRRPTQSLDYVGDPTNVRLLAHNPTAFVDPGTSRLLNFGNRIAGVPQPTWPNGSAETTWDYGPTRAKRVSSSPCNEFFIDYQIPVQMLDASAQGGPKITRSTPISMVFCTANSLNNPFQKDCAINARWTGEAATPAPFGDYVSFNQSEPYAQPIVSKVVATPPNTCPGSYTLTATVQDTLAVVNGAVVPSVQAVRFYYYHDANGNGLADDGGSWTFAADGSLRAGTFNTWTGQWSGAGLPKGSYLIGVQALDDNTMVDLGVTPSGVNNRTFSYVAGDAQNRIQVGGTSYATVPAHDPAIGSVPSENWWGNPSVTGSQVALVGLALNDCGVAPTISKAVSQSNIATGGATTFTVTVTNSTGSPITLSRIDDPLPSGFLYQSTATFTNGGTTVTGYAAPAVNATGTVSWVPAAPLTVAPNTAVVLSFVAQAGAVAGNYNNTASAATSYGSLTSNPVALQVDAARLSITKTPSQYSINPDGSTQLTYTLRYSNDSAVTVTGAKLSDPLPAGVTYVGCSGGTACSNVGGTVGWTLGALAGGASGTATVAVTVNTSYASSALLNNATVSATAPDGSTVSASGSTTVAVNVPTPAFTLNKMANNVRVAPGGSTVWTLSYRNYGTGQATGVVISDTLPAGTTFTSCTGGCAQSGGVVTWNLGTVAAGATASVTLTTGVASATPFTFPNPLSNTARLTWTGNATGVTATADVGVTGASCSAVYYFHGPTTSRTATLISPAAGDVAINEQPGTTTLVFPGVAPAGGINAAGKTLTISFYMASSNGNATFQVTLFNVTRNQTIASSSAQGVSNSQGAAILQNFTTTVGAGVTINAGDQLEWRFTLGGSGQSPTFWYNSTTYNSRSSFCDPAAPANLTLTKTVNQAQVNSVPANLQYTLTFSNTGGADAASVTLQDTLPANVTMTSATLNGNAVNLGATPYANPYTFAVNSTGGGAGVVRAGESGTLVIQTTANASASGTLTNNASLAVAGTPVTTASVATTVGSLAGGGAPALTISKSADRNTLSAGGAVVYTLTVVNTGQASASSVVVRDVLPVQGYFSYGGCGASAGSCAQASGTLTWTIGTLASGASATATVTMNASASSVPVGVTLLDNTATVADSSFCTGGSPPASCTSNTVTVALSGNPNLTLSKAATPLTAQPGDTVTYTLTVGNTGSSPATAVVVSDPIPSGVRYAGSYSASVGTGSFDALNNRMVFQVGTLASGATAALSFQTTVQALAAGSTPIVNTASASAQNAPARTASATVTASAQPQLTLSKQAPAQVGYPAATLTQSASNTTQLRVNDSSQIALDQYVAVGGSVARVVALSPTTLTLASPVTAATGSLVQAAITYTLTYQNTGTATAAGVTLTDTLPAGMAWVASEPSASVTGNTVTWSLGSLEPQAGGSVRLVALPSAAGTYLNQASVQCGACGPAVQASVSTSVGGLVVAKRTNTPTVAAGGLADYVIEVRNTASTAIANVSVTDVLPSGFQYESTTEVSNNGAPVTPGSAPAPGSTELAWGTFTVQPGQVIAVRFAARVSANAGTATYQNDAGATPQNRTVAYDFLASTTEDVVVLGADAGLISGVVFHDTDNSGSYDAAQDLPLSGVSVQFFDAGNTLVYEEVTDAGGRYARVVPLGTWSVRAVTTGIPAGLTLGSGFNNPASVNVASAQSVQTDMGFVNPTALPDLSIAKSHSGNFAQGQVGAQYQLVVTNRGTGPSSGTVTVTDTLPAGLTATNIGGAGWSSCTLATLACTRSDPLAAGASYPAITLTVNVAANAAPLITNQAAVSGGGETNTSNNTATDATTVTSTVLAPDLTLAKTHAGNFSQGQVGAVYTLTVRNTGAGPTSGTVTVVDTLPSGLTATALGGSGWSCVLPALSCTRSDTLAAGASWPAITVTVAVSVNAAASLTNTATVSGGGDSTPGNNTASDVTAIAACNCTLTGHVFQDLNRNGVKDAGEPPFANVQITLQQVTQGTSSALQLRSAMQVKAGTWAAVTDINGNFSVQLPGVTTVQLFVTPPTGYAETTGTSGQTVTVGQVLAAALPVGLVPAAPTSAAAIPMWSPWMWALMSLLLGGLGLRAQRGRQR